MRWFSPQDHSAPVIHPEKHAQSKFPGQPLPPVLLVQHPHPSVFRGVPVAQGGAAVRGAVVHQNDLQVLQRLPPQGVHAPLQILLRPVDRHNDAYPCSHARHSFRPISSR